MFESLKERYEKNWCRKDQLQRFVSLGAISEKEYEQITGETLEGEPVIPPTDEVPVDEVPGKEPEEGEMV